MTPEEIKNLKRGDLLYAVREIDVEGDEIYRLGVFARVVIGVTDLRVTTERQKGGDRRIHLKRELGHLSTTPAGAREIFVRYCEVELKSAERRLQDRHEKLAKAKALVAASMEAV